MIEKPKCSDCAWFDADSMGSRVCRKSLPSPNAQGVGSWPIVSGNDWCAQHMTEAVYGATTLLHAYLHRDALLRLQR